MVVRLCHWYGTQVVLLVLCYQSGTEVCARGVLYCWCGTKVVGLMCRYGSANGINLKPRQTLSNACYLWRVNKMFLASHQFIGQQSCTTHLLFPTILIFATLYTDTVYTNSMQTLCQHSAAFPHLYAVTQHIEGLAYNHN